MSEAAVETPIVTLDGVGWSAEGGVPVLRGIDLAIPPRGRVAVVGRSGAGKTTLATILAGLAEPTSGRVRRAARPDELAADVGLVFQEPERGFFEETVLEDVSFGPRNAGHPPEEVRRRARDAIRLVGLDPDEIGARAPETLSGGEARRVAIAGVLALGPRLLVFDEPTCGLDADGVARFRAILATLRERGVAYFLVSHDLGLVLEECERVLVLVDGAIAWDGPPLRLREGLPPEWREEALWGGELALVADAMRERGWLEEDAPLTAAALADAWARHARDTRAG